MEKEKFEKRKNQLFKKIKSSDELTEGIKDKIKSLYGPRGEKAIKTVENGKIERKDKKWIVEGSEREYEIVKSHCSCYDYVLNIAPGKADVDMCYHALSKRIRELLDS